LAKSTRCTPEAALAYVSRGWAVVAVKPRSKQPRHKDWTNLRVGREQITKYFHEDDNIGLLLGDPSGGLVDVDLDCPEALKLAPLFLPTTAMIHGRKSKPASHRWYRVSPPYGKTQKFCDPDGDTLVELRSTGGQTVVPPSMHESGESIMWESEGEPDLVDPEQLLKSVAKLAAAAMLARHWPMPGSRHGVALALGGLLLRSGWKKEETVQFVEAVAAAAGDEEALQRAEDVISTAKAVATGRKVTGGKALARIIGDTVFKQVRALLDLSAQIKAMPYLAAVDTDTGVFSAIRDVVLDPGTSSFDKRREVASIVEGGLSALGDFLRTKDGRAFFFHKGERRLYDVDQTSFRHLLTEISGLAATESFFNFTLERLQASAYRTAHLVEVHAFAHFDNQKGLLAVSDGTTGVWVRERRGDWQPCHNGDYDLLFLTDSDAKPWAPDFSGNGSALGWFLSQFMFANSPLAAEDYRALMLIWLMQQFFPPLRKTRMIPAFLGPQGSGKTTAMRLVGRLLLGPEFDVTGLQRDREDAFIAAACNRVILGLDNADSKIPFLPDALARYATGQRYQLRQLYTTNEEASYSPRTILMISSRDPQFNRPDVAERLLPFTFDRPRDYKSEFGIFAELEKRRAGIMGSLLLRIGKIADALPEHPTKDLRFRMADFASFGERVFASYGKSSNWIELLGRLEKAQTDFASEGDGLIDALRLLLGAERVEEVPISELFQKCRSVAESHGFIFPRSCQSFGRRLSSTRRVIEIELGVRFQESRVHGGQRVVSLVMRDGYEGDVGDESGQAVRKENVREPA
jgi:Bifunctional DNA primase/polymerase, N-terminal